MARSRRSRRDAASAARVARGAARAKPPRLSGVNILRRVMGMILASVTVNAVLMAIGNWVGLPKP